MATAAQIAEHYDSLAFVYRNFWGDHIHHGLFFTGKESPKEAQERMVDECARKDGFEADVGARPEEGELRVWPRAAEGDFERVVVEFQVQRL